MDRVEADKIDMTTNTSPSHDVEETKEGTLIEKDWSEDEERRLVRRLDFLLMPLLVAGFFALQLDRSNISNAMTSTFTEDLSITRQDVSTGNQLQLTGIIIAEIPANLLLQKIGSAPWLIFQALCWGFVGVFQAFINNKSSFYATRFLLGFFEAGYIPGSMLIMSLFYKREEIAVRTAIFYFGNYFSAGTGSLIAAGVLQMEGMRGLSGWQWLFIIDGSCTMVMCIVFFFFLPSSPTHTLPVCRLDRLNFFSERDRHILHQRIVLNDPRKRVPLSQMSLKSILQTLVNIQLWGHFGINLLGLVPKGGLQLYSPTIIKSLGFETTKANALASVSNYGVCAISFLVSWLSDRTKLRGLCCIISCAFPMIFAGALYGLPTNADVWTRYAIFTLVNSGNGVIQGLNDAWVSSNAVSYQQRSIGLALAVIGSNLGGLAGQQLFQDSDAPRYPKGFTAILCIYGACIILSAIQTAGYAWRNKRAISSHDENVEDENGDLVERRRFDL